MKIKIKGSILFALFYYMSTLPSLVESSWPPPSKKDYIVTQPFIGSVVYTSRTRAPLVLDENQFPVVAFSTYEKDNSAIHRSNISILHCVDRTCSTGGKHSIVNVESADEGLEVLSLALDRAGNPVVEYGISSTIKILKCGDADCKDGDSRSNAIVKVKGKRLFGLADSLVLDSNDFPVFLYHERSQDWDVGRLILHHCINENCAGSGVSNTVAGPGEGGFKIDDTWGASLALDVSGNPVVAFVAQRDILYDRSLYLLVCGDQNCSPDTTTNKITVLSKSDWWVLNDVSLALDTHDNPVVAVIGTNYWVAYLIRCFDPDCVESSTTQLPGSARQVAITLDDADIPTLAIRNTLHSQNLGVVYCEFEDCSNSKAINVCEDYQCLDNYPSIQMNKKGHPVISFTSDTWPLSKNQEEGLFVVSVDEEEPKHICLSGPFDNRREWDGGYVLMTDGDELHSCCDCKKDWRFVPDSDIYIKQRSNGKLIIRKGTPGDSVLVWSSKVTSLDHAGGAAFTRLQRDGNLITRAGSDKSGKILWKSRTTDKQKKNYFLGLTKDMKHLQIWRGTPNRPRKLIVEWKTRMPTLTPTPTSPPTPALPKMWLQIGNDIEGLNEYDESGYSVSMTTLGNIVVVGSPAEREGRPGSAQVYKLNSSTNEWNLFDKSLQGGDDTANDEKDRFGRAVSCSNDGSVIAISAPSKNKYTGSVYIYRLDVSADTITLVQELQGDNTGDFFGRSIDVSGEGSAIVVGANQEYADDDPLGYVKVYHKDDDDDTFVQIGNTLAGLSSGDTFGDGVSISNDGNILAFVTPYGYNRKGYGKVYQYNKSSNTWDKYGSNQDEVLVGDKKYDDQFGDALSLSSLGDVLAIAAPGSYGINNDKENSGTIKIFQLNPSTKKWEQLGSQIDGEAENDFSGRYQGTKLSDDGMIVAFGLPGDDNYNAGGSTRLYEYDSMEDKWFQKCQDIDGESEDGGFGRSIDLSGDGSIVAIGANAGINSGVRRGRVRIYKCGD